MKTRPWLVALVLATFGAASTNAKTLSFPNDRPLFLVTFPDSWDTKANGDAVTSRIQNMTVSVFPIEKVRNVNEALESVKKRVAPDYEDFRAGSGKEATLGGIKFSSAKGSGKRQGTGINLLLYAFAADCDHYFGVSSSADYESAEAHLDEANSIVASIKPAPSNQRSTEIAYPRDKPAFVIDLPCFVVAEQTAERLVLRDKRRDTSLYIDAIPQRDGVTDLDKARAWLSKNAEGLVKRMKLEGATSFSGPAETRLSNLETPVLHVRYEGHGDKEAEVRIWLFAPDGRRYFCAYAEMEALRELEKNDELGDKWETKSWAEREVESILPVK